MPHRLAALLALSSLTLACDSGVPAAEHEKLKAELEATRAELQAARDALEAQEPPRAPAKAFAIELPKAAGGGAVEKVAVLVIAADGSLTLDGESVSAEEIDAKLRDAVASQPGLGLVLDAGPDVGYARIVDAIDRAKKAGFENVGLGPRGEPEPAPEG